MQDNNIFQKSLNPHRSVRSFWEDFADIHPDKEDLLALQDSLYSSRIADSSIVSDYSRVFDTEGIIGVETARALLGDAPQEMTIRAFEMNEWPEETYDIELEVVGPDDENYPPGSPIEVTYSPPQEDLSGLYDFTVLDADYILVDR